MNVTRKISLLISLLILLSATTRTSAIAAKDSMSLYGFIMLDAGYNFTSSHPDWFDVMRATKLPSYVGEFDPEGNVFFGVRQSRFAVYTAKITSLGLLTTRFDFDLFAVGESAGETIFHLVNAYGQLGKIGAGQTASVFMDPEMFTPPAYTSHPIAN